MRDNNFRNSNLLDFTPIFAAPPDCRPLTTPLAILPKFGENTITLVP